MAEGRYQAGTGEILQGARSRARGEAVARQRPLPHDQRSYIEIEDFDRKFVTVVVHWTCENRYGNVMLTMNAIVGDRQDGGWSCFRLRFATEVQIADWAPEVRQRRDRIEFDTLRAGREGRPSGRQ